MLMLGRAFGASLGQPFILRVLPCCLLTVLSVLQIPGHFLLFERRVKQGFRVPWDAPAERHSAVAECAPCKGEEDFGPH